MDIAEKHPKVELRQIKIELGNTRLNLSNILIINVIYKLFHLNI